MLFKFKSKACADLIMLEPDGRRILQAMIGSDPVKGVVRMEDLPQALARLQAAVVQDEVQRQAHIEKNTRCAGAADLEHASSVLSAVHFAQRAAPMQSMLQRCIKEKADLVWGI